MLMSVILPSEPPLTRTVPCWYCDTVISPEHPAVAWAGPGEAILLHGPCARSLGSHLIADSRECELADGADARWRSRAARAAVSALTRCRSNRRSA